MALTAKEYSGERARPGCSFPRGAENSGTRGAFRHTRGRVCSPGKQMGSQRDAIHQPGAGAPGDDYVPEAHDAGRGRDRIGEFFGMIKLSKI